MGHSIAAARERNRSCQRCGAVATRCWCSLIFLSLALCVVGDKCSATSSTLAPARTTLKGINIRSDEELNHELPETDVPHGLNLLKGSIQDPNLFSRLNRNSSSNTQDFARGWGYREFNRTLIVEESHKESVLKTYGDFDCDDPITPTSFMASGSEAFESSSATGITAFARSFIRRKDEKRGEILTKEVLDEASIVSSSVDSLAGIDQGIPIDVLNNLGMNETWKVNNSLFEGEACLLLRDHPKCGYDFDGEDNVFFELQVQGKFKRRQKGPIYLALEVPQVHEYSVRWPLKALINACIAFIKSWGYKWVHFSFGGKGDMPHISTPAFQAFDRLIISGAGETLPRLGEPVREAHIDTVKRKKFEFHHEIDTSATYTMSFNHTYLDPVQWRMFGIPLVKSFDIVPMTNVMRLSIYEVVGEDGRALTPTNWNVQSIAPGKHTKRNMIMWVQFLRKDDSRAR